MRSASRVAIIGSGIIGLSCACYCARRGLAVTVIDRLPAQHDGCSFGNAGMIVPSHFVPLAAPGMVALGLKWMANPESPFYIQPRLDRDLLDWGWKFWRASTAERVQAAAPVLRDLHFASRAEYEAWAAQPGVDFGLVQRGLLMLCRTARALEEEAHYAERARQLGVPAEVLDARETAARDPGATLDVIGSVLFPKDCHLSPARFMAALREESEQRGVRFLWDSEVTRVQRDGSRIRAVSTTRGEVEADEFVIAGGAWSTGLASSLGLQIPMQAGKGYSLTLTQPRQLPELCSILTEARVAVTPMGSTLRFGGTMEMAGLNEDINAVRVRGIVKAAVQYFPEFQEADFAGIAPWRGLRPCSPDGMPYLGRTRRFENLILATGHAMMGLSLGPITGKIVAELAVRASAPFDLTLLSPDRYG